MRLAKRRAIRPILCMCIRRRFMLRCWNFALYGGLAWLYRRKRFDGQVFAVYLMAYSVNRFIVEFFRGDYQPEQLWLGWIKPGQQLSLFLLPVGIALAIFLYNAAAWPKRE